MFKPENKFRKKILHLKFIKGLSLSLMAVKNVCFSKRVNGKEHQNKTKQQSIKNV